MKKFLPIVLIFLAGCGVQKTTDQATNSVQFSSISNTSYSSEILQSSISSESEKQTESILASYIWLTEKQAQELASSQNRKFRVIEIDWQPQMVTMDIVEWRINAKLENWKITEANIESYSITE